MVMKKSKLFVGLFISLAVQAVLSISCTNQQIELEPQQEEVNLKSTHTLSVVGVDNSYMEKAYECGAVYKDENMNDRWPLYSYKENGMNYIRLRLFVNPDFSDPQVCNSLDYTIFSAKRIKNEGYKLLLDFHYSDRWADPANQTKPEAWKNMDWETLRTKVWSYTKDVMTRFKNEGCLPDMVQIGNEITYGMLWPNGYTSANGTDSQWRSFSDLWMQGYWGVKNVADIPIMVHTTLSGDALAAKSYYQKCIDYGMVFDVIGLSFYSEWHGTYNDLKNTLSTLNSSFNKRIIIAETNYPSAYGSGKNKLEDYTWDGQAAYARKIIDICKSYDKCDGLFWWRGEETKWDCDVPHWNTGLYDAWLGCTTPALKEFKKH